MLDDGSNKTPSITNCKVLDVYCFENSGKVTKLPLGFLDESYQNILRENKNADFVSVIEHELVTGQKHQIRSLSSEYLNCPILFDYKYGFKESLCQTPMLLELIKEYPEYMAE